VHLIHQIAIHPRNFNRLEINGLDAMAKSPMLNGLNLEGKDYSTITTFVRKRQFSLQRWGTTVISRNASIRSSKGG
jgi:hypothetical protein